jgi:hypothetical protein
MAVEPVHFMSLLLSLKGNEVDISQFVVHLEKGTVALLSSCLIHGLDTDNPSCDIHVATRVGNKKGGRHLLFPLSAITTMSWDDSALTIAGVSFGEAWSLSIAFQPPKQSGLAQPW